MWCGHCEQDVPGAVAAADQRLCCPRCENELAAGREPAADSSPFPRIEVDDWELEDDLIAARQVVRRRAAPPETAADEPQRRAGMERAGWALLLTAGLLAVIALTSVAIGFIVAVANPPLAVLGLAISQGGLATLTLAAGALSAMHWRRQHALHNRLRALESELQQLARQAESQQALTLPAALAGTRWLRAG